jgi:hypothetical protein
MYIHRIVIDANRINTRGRIAAMNSLEALHDAGLIEIFQTSTLPVEFLPWPPGKQKALKYAVISGSSMVYLTDSNVADAQVGSSGRASRHIEIHQSIFGQPSLGVDRLNDMRDALHIDQANQHDADFFVTDERVILNASPALAAIGIGTRVCSAEDCLSDVQTYFAKNYGTTDVATLVHVLGQAGPILLGSNSCGGTAFTDLESGETLLAFERTCTGIGIRAVIRGKDGSLLLTIAPAQAFSFASPDAQVRMEVGTAALTLGEQRCRSFAITVNEEPVLAGRVLRNGRLLLHNASLYSKRGRLVLRVTRDALELSGGSVSAHPAP